MILEMYGIQDSSFVFMATDRGNLEYMSYFPLIGTMYRSSRVQTVQSRKREFLKETIVATILGLYC